LDLVEKAERRVPVLGDRNNESMLAQKRDHHLAIAGSSSATRIVNWRRTY
jgi:hypothetical protein